jgi:aldehyde dehydrogenase (NAD+)
MKTREERNSIKAITTHYIDGAFVESHGREVMDIIRPTDGQVIARVTLADEEDTRRAIAAAKRAFATYGRSTKDERAKILRRLNEAASARLGDLVAAMVEEYGGVVQFAGLIVQSGVNAFMAAEKALHEIPWTRSWAQNNGDLGTGWRGRFDYRVECERVVHLPQACLGRCRWVYRCC